MFRFATKGKQRAVVTRERTSRGGAEAGTRVQGSMSQKKKSLLLCPSA